MTRIDDPNDHAAAIRDIVRRIRQLETASPLNHSSISHGTGLAVNLAAGIHVEGDGSVTAGVAEMSRANGGRVGAGGTFIRPDGIWNADGTVAFLVNVTGVANATYEGQVRGRQGVVGPINGVQVEHGAAIAAADTKAGNAGSVAQSAWNLANAKATTASVQAVQDDVDGIKDGTVSMQSPTMIQPKITGLTSGTSGGDWAPILYNTLTGRLRFMDIS